MYIVIFLYLFHFFLFNLCNRVVEVISSFKSITVCFRCNQFCLCVCVCFSFSLIYSLFHLNNTILFDEFPFFFFFFSSTCPSISQPIATNRTIYLSFSFSSPLLCYKDGFVFASIYHFTFKICPMEWT